MPNLPKTATSLTVTSVTESSLETMFVKANADYMVCQGMQCRSMVF